VLGLGAGADVRVLGLDEVADFRARFQYRAGAQMRERADHAAAADAHAATQHREGLDPRAGRDLDAFLDPGGRRIVHDHSRKHVVEQDALARNRLNRREIGEVVDAEDLFPIVLQADGRAFARVQHRERGVGQVELALRVVGAESGQRLAERRDRQGVNAGVHFLDCALFVVGVVLLDDAAQSAVFFSQDAAVAARIRDDRGEHRVTLREQSLEHFGAEQGGVAAQDQHPPIGRQAGQSAAHRVSGATRLFLQHDAPSGETGGSEPGFDRRAMAGSDHERAAHGRGQTPARFARTGAQHVREQRNPAEVEQRLRPARADSCGLPACEHDNVKVRCSHGPKGRAV